jgi:hypothetical protein
MQGSEETAGSFAETFVNTFKNIIEFAKNLGGAFRTLFERFKPFINFITGPHLTFFKVILAAITLGINKLINSFNN